jgi:hypothetical protein
MERKRLNSGKWVIGMLLMGCAGMGATERAQGQDYRCPSAQGKSPLVDADVFDGPPSGKVELVPDVSQGKMGNSYALWNVGFLSGSSHRVYLVRRYEGLGPAQAVTAEGGSASAAVRGAGSAGAGYGGLLPVRPAKRVSLFVRQWSGRLG